MSSTPTDTANKHAGVYKLACLHCSGVLDTYDVIRALQQNNPHFNDPAVQHAFKKLWRVGASHKSTEVELEEIILSLQSYSAHLKTRKSE
jgi:hypothetical protein